MNKNRKQERMRQYVLTTECQDLAAVHSNIQTPACGHFASIRSCLSTEDDQTRVLFNYSNVDGWQKGLDRGTHGAKRTLHYTLFIQGNL